MEEYHWPARDAVHALNQRLRLPATGREQDWEIELADDTRLPEWLELFRSGRLGIEERSALALLIIFSLPWTEIAVRASEAAVVAVREAIIADREVHKRMLSYWSNISDEEMIEALLT